MMVEVAKNIWVGNDDAYERDLINYTGWTIVHAAKDPWHRKAVGYTGRGCPKDHPEYLYAVRGNELSLNMVDVDNPDYFHRDMIIFVVGFMLIMTTREHDHLLIHCNRGESRSPSLAMLLLAIMGNKIPNKSFEAAERAFKAKYAPYNPKQGIREHLRKNWHDYIKP